MDFSPRTFDDATLAFWKEVQAFFDEHLTPDIIETEHRTGNGLDHTLARKLGAKGWIEPTWPVEEGGIGATPVQAAILQLETISRFMPTITHGTTSLVAPAVRRWIPDPLRSEILRGVARGEVFFCLGYTEPDAGSDLASVKTKATRDGEEWVIEGSKIFSTGAQNCDYAFLVTRSNPDVAKHKGITMFLMPLKVPGVEIQPIHTLGGERTNTVFYDNVRISDKYRMGPVDDGWNVLNGPLAAEHGRGDGEFSDQGNIGTMFARFTRAALNTAVQWARTPGQDGTRPIDDPFVRQRLANVELSIEVSELTTGPMGRILSSELMIRDGADLMDMVGPEALIDRGADGVIGDGWVEHIHRFAQGTATYGGTVEIHRNLVAEHFLGLPRSRPPSSMSKR